MSEIVSIILLLLLLGFYVYIISIAIRRDMVRIVHRTFFKAVNSIFSTLANEDEYIKQISMNYKKLSEKNPNLSNETKSFIDLLEEMVFQIDTLDSKKFKKIYKIEPSNDIRTKALKIIDDAREKNPFVSLSSKEANLLISLRNAIESNNIDLGRLMLKQLADELEILESNIKQRLTWPLLTRCRC
ncbi:hypothetical protein GFC01_01945 [Desulfofundulus thermobenzoicus]|uniref:Uncharacterized protein n=1 Tax=Desulfofundulus thermobenzoicus TaxID=29376 RepID=A0A6N7IM41_9FIRM|nr:hypothetical protein [Desulfofundulus thermobenzoicus]MQL51050.1 hypothetical protein [Desulfofundulus thermobenzoicus]